MLLYKPIGSDLVVGDSKIRELTDFDNLFMLAIQTKEQRERLVAGASTILCIDATHGTNQYGFQLLNLIVPDEFGKGYPVGHFICNRMDDKVQHFFFSAIRERCPNLDLHCVMTDDDYSSWNALVSVFGNSIKHLLCHWHVLRAWSRKLNSLVGRVGNNNLYDEMFASLRTLYLAHTQSEFQILVDGFCKKYLKSAKAFVDYF